MNTAKLWQFVLGKQSQHMTEKSVLDKQSRHDCGHLC